MRSRILSVLAPLSSVVTQREADLSDLVAARLSRAGIEFAPEVWLNDTDRIDYLVGRVGIELKLTGPTSAVTRQLARYADSDRIDELLLVTTKLRHKQVPTSLRGKPVTVIHVGGFL